MLCLFCKTLALPSASLTEMLVDVTDTTTGIWRAWYPAELQGYLSATVVAGVKMRCFAVSATLTTTVLPSPLDTSSCSCCSGCNWRLAVGSSPRGGLALYMIRTVSCASILTTRAASASDSNALEADKASVRSKVPSKHNLAKSNWQLRKHSTHSGLEG